MTAQITELITGLDGAEVVRDLVASILAVESEGQVELASAVASANPDDWKLDVYVERSNPWEAWLEADADGEFVCPKAPVVNVWLESTSQDGKASTVDGKAAASIINVDCFGFAVSRGSIDGHLPADRAAAFEAQRAARVCRRILFSGHYTYLGSLRREHQLVFGRRLQSLQFFQPDSAAKSAVKVVGARLALEVRHSLEQPQVLGEVIETITAQVKRAEDGKVIVTAVYGEPVDD